MRHKHGYRKLGRTSAHRAALLKNLTISIINVGKIETTLPKAKELRSYVEKLITTALRRDEKGSRPTLIHATFMLQQIKSCTRTRKKSLGRIVDTDKATQNSIKRVR